MSLCRMIAFIPFLLAISIAIFLGATVIHGIKDPMDVLSAPVLIYALGIIILGIVTIRLSASADNEK